MSHWDKEDWDKRGQGTRMSSRRYCFTLNNPEDTAAPRLCFGEVAEYCVWQLEEAPTTGTRHLQGYLELKDKVRVSALTKLLQAHYTVCTGTQKQNIEYCTKEPRLDGPWEFGSKKQEHGVRKGLSVAAELAKTGCTKRKLVEECTEEMIRYSKGLDLVRTMFIQPRVIQTQGIYVYGLQNSGKTYLMKKTYPDAYWKDNGPWWDGYDGQSVILWDEFDWSQVNIHTIKQVLNHAPLKVPIKGGMVEFTSKLVVFMSNTKLEICYENQSKADQDAWHSRLRYFKMEDRVLIPKPSPLWEKRFNAVHDAQLPDYTSFEKE